MTREPRDPPHVTGVADDEPLVERAAGAILEAVPPTMRAIRQQMRSGRPSGMSVSQFRVLLFVRRHPGTSLSAVSEHLGVTLPAASQLVERLVVAAYVERLPNVRAGRGVELRLTEAGGTVVAEQDGRARAWLTERLGGLDERALAALVAALADLRRAIEE